LLERQREGIYLAKRAGKYKGRKRIAKPDNWDEVYPLYKNREITGAEAMSRLGLKRNVFYAFVKSDISSAEEVC
jgi:DNA invertase Pin-like site-specific DNA recombinase